MDLVRVCVCSQNVSFLVDDAETGQVVDQRFRTGTQMTVHGRTCRVAVALAQCGQHSPVIACALLRPSVNGRIHRFQCVAGDLRHQLRQFRGVGGHVDAAMKLVVQPHRTFVIICSISFFELTLDPLQLRQLLGGDPAGCPLRQLTPDTTLDQFKAAFPTARFVERRDVAGVAVDAYAVTIEEKYRYRNDTYGYLAHDEQWFFFKGNRFVKTAEPNQWP